MARKLRIEAEIPLHDDHFEAARTLQKFEEHLGAFEKAVKDTHAEAKFKHEVVAARESKKTKKPRLVPRDVQAGAYD